MSIAEQVVTVEDAQSDSWRTWFPVAVLTLVLFVSYVDRFVLAILVQPIKTELGLSDSQIGLLTGFAFSACYALGAIPLARLADKGSRRNVVVLSLVVWSGMTALCGMSRNFVQLFLARVGVGFGEAGCIPASHAMIADLVPPRRRAFAYALYSTGGGLGMAFGLAAGGALDAHFGWRGTFLTLGLPGIVLALIVRAVLREPKRGRFAGLERLAPATEPERGALRTLWSNRAFRHVVLAAGFSTMSVFAAAQWMPAFLERSFGGSRAAIGGWMALAQGPGVLFGMVLGGLLADRLSKKDPMALFRIVVATGLVGWPLNLLVYTAGRETLCYVAYCAMLFVTTLGTGSMVAITQSIVPPGVRATASATGAFSTAFLGIGAGSFLIGWLSDRLQAVAGQESLRWALLAVVLPSALLTTWHFHAAGGRVRQRLQNGVSA